MISLDKIKESALYSFKSEKELVDSIHELVHLFNYERHSISAYLENPRLVSAYAMFYMSTNIGKLQQILNLIPVLKQDLEELTFVDIGSGPGTFLYEYKKIAMTQKKVYGVEISQAMRDFSQQFLGSYFNENEFEISSEVPKIKDATLICFTNSFNEMGVEKALSYIKRLNPKAILFIEPGTKETFQKILEIREKLILDDFAVEYPCPSSGSCPLINSSKDWCHQFVRLNHSDEIKRLCQLVQKDRSLQSLSLFYFRTQENSKHSTRILRKYPHQKHGIVLDICRFEDNFNKLYKFESLKRNYSKSQFKKYDKMMAGEEIDFEVTKIINDHLIRGKIIDQE
jgi:ribosomal protein RSM22 (predicted rRNA methylase)